MNRVARVLELIRQMSPSERRRLFRRVQAVGLLSREELLTDRDALQIALSVQRATDSGRRSLDAALTEARSSKDPRQETSATYRSPISGHVVVGSPRAGVDEVPSTMRPLPGQAPEQPIKIVFDGGSKGNPGRGYGSYALDWPGHPRQVVRLQFGNQVTNNEAEYDTLIAALEAVVKRLREMGADPKGASVEIWGDSQLVINQVNGEWQVNKPELQLRRDRVRALLKQLGPSRLQYHGRDNNVDILGH